MKLTNYLCVVSRSLQTLKIYNLIPKITCRHETSWARPKEHRAATMRAWQIHEYGGVEKLALSNTIRVPSIKRPDEVLIEVHAASVNPLDARMVGGYGSATLNPLRKCGLQRGLEFPLVLGRDFSGQVVETGMAARKFKPGDEVWGAVSAIRQGTHADYVVASALEISHKPNNLSHVEAASIPYVAATSWAALSTVGGMSPSNTNGKRVLVFGGSGGVGTFAIQLLKAWGAEVTTTCSTDAVNKVLELGADIVVDYKTQNVLKSLHEINGFDVILDTVGGPPQDSNLKLLKPYNNGKYITIVPPVLKNNDELGMPFGMLKNTLSAGCDTLKGIQSGVSYRWALFIPNGKALATVAQLVETGQILPVIERVYSFEELPTAYEKVAAKHNRGKTVVDMYGESSVENQGEEESSTPSIDTQKQSSDSKE